MTELSERFCGHLYKLEGTVAVPCANPDEWASQFNSGDTVVSRTTVGRLVVSTVFTGIDYGDFDVFETVIFAADKTYWLWDRHLTWEEAVESHADAIAIALSLQEAGLDETTPALKTRHA
jgi:hypothetical protein